jgi:hypothetical protein
MLATQERFSYSVTFKLNVIKYVKEHRNRAAERYFGPPPRKGMCFANARGRITEVRREQTSFLHICCKMA